MAVLPAGEPAFSITMILLHPFSAAVTAAAIPAPPPPMITKSASRFPIFVIILDFLSSKQIFVEI
jgi:hypothetical protein